MWVIVKDKLGNKRHVNTKFLTDFYFNGEDTIIWLINGAPIEVPGDCEKDIMMAIRMSEVGLGVKQIGE